MIYLCLRFLRCFEKWSELGKIRKMGEKMAVLEYPINILLLFYAQNGIESSTAARDIVMPEMMDECL